MWLFDVKVLGVDFISNDYISSACICEEKFICMA